MVRSTAIASILAVLPMPAVLAIFPVLAVATVLAVPTVFTVATVLPIAPVFAVATILIVAGVVFSFLAGSAALAVLPDLTVSPVLAVLAGLASALDGIPTSSAPAARSALAAGSALAARAGLPDFTRGSLKVEVRSGDMTKHQLGSERFCLAQGGQGIAGPGRMNCRRGRNAWRGDQNRGRKKMNSPHWKLLWWRLATPAPRVRRTEIRRA